MADTGNNQMVADPSGLKMVEGLRSRSDSAALATNLHGNYHEDVSDGDDMTVERLSGDDAQSIMEVSISPAATRLTSPRTPAVEKAAAMEELDGGRLCYSDEEIAPPIESPNIEEHKDILHPERLQEPELSKGQRQDLLLGALPSPVPQNTRFPTSWQASPKLLVVERPEDTRSALPGALGVTKRRSFSGSGEALKRLFPSMPKAPSFIPSLPSFTYSIIPKSRNRGLSLSREPGPSLHTSKPPASDMSVNKRPSAPHLPSANARRDSITPPRSKIIRRATSDESLLYYSMSRASSLGDDTRFENHTEMVNSRVKAIRDSFQDRSSFRLPSMPSLLNMPIIPRVPSFNFNMNFAFNLNTGTTPLRWGTESTEGNISINDARKKLRTVANQAVTPGIVGASVSKPEAVIEATQPVPEAANPSCLDRAMSNLTGDIVIMGGYRGSILRSAKSPHRQLWVPVKVGLNIRKVNLEVGLEPEDEERMEEHIFASGMIKNIGPVDISKRLFKRLRECENARNGSLRIWDYGYDWRLSPHLLSRKLIEFLETLPSNKEGVYKENSGALIIAHSLGGLVTRHAVNQRPELFSGVIYAGVPTACINILGPLRNGDAVLLSSRVLTAQVNFTLRTSFVLLPIDGGCFIDINTKEKYPVDFFNVEDWIKYRWSPCTTDPPLPPKAPPVGALANILRTSSLTSLSLPGKKSSSVGMKNSSRSQGSSSLALVGSNGDQKSQSPPLANYMTGAVQEVGRTDRTLAPQMRTLTDLAHRNHSTNGSVSTTVTIPRDKALAYLRRTLAETKQFKLELAARPDHAANNRYPPFAVIYGKSVPTVFAAKVDGRDGIACTDAYDNLAFASGDGVCLAREAMLPEGYFPVSRGRISSNRGHVTLLGDLNAVGRAIEAIMKGRAKGLGIGV